MPRTRPLALATLAAGALAAAGVAAASQRAQTTQQAAATFAAGTVSHSRTKSCTGSDGAYQETVATYTGTASSSDARLNGSLEIRARSVLNATSGLGWVEGSFRVRGSEGGARGTLHAAIADGKAVGSLVGEAGRPEARLVASLASAFSPSAGFSSGQLGTGSASLAGVLFQRGACSTAKRTKTTAVSHLELRPDAVLPPSSVRGKASGSFTLDLTRDASGTITGATAVFYVNYRFDGSVTITGLALHQGARGSNGSTVLDAATGTIADPDGSGNVTKVVTGVSGSLAQALLSDPRGYYVELTTSNGALRAQLDGFSRR